MRNVPLLLCAMLLLISYNITTAQDDCDPVEIARNIDSAYNSFLVHRSSFEYDTVMRTAEDFSVELQEILGSCGSVANSGNPLYAGYAVGDGTFENPYGFNQAGEAPDGVTVRPTNIIRPADDLIPLEEPANHEWVIVEVEVGCPLSYGEDCRITYENFRIVGESGTLYDSEDVYEYSNQINAWILPGSVWQGGIAFIVPNEEANLRLVYHPEFYTVVPEQSDISYHRAQPSIEVTSTARLIIRGGPGTQYAPLDALERDTRVNAIGRNASGSWIRIDNGWVSAEYINTGATDVNLLPVMEEVGG